MNALGIVVAVFAAVGFAISTSLQHHANTQLVSHDGTSVEDDRVKQRGHFASLLRQPWWVVGQVVALAAFAMHAWALRIGLLVVVQPVVVSGIVLAVPVRAALERRLPGLREIGTVALTTIGLTLFLLAVHPSAVPTDQLATPAAVAATIIGIAVAAAAGRWGRGRVGLARATGYGAASGILFGLTAGLVKLAAVAAATAPGTGTRPTLLALLTAWPTWLVPVVGIAGVALNQRAYRAGPLSASMPLLNIVDVLVAIAFGVVVFGEVPAHHLVDVAGQAAGIALMLGGLRRLARGPAVETVVPVSIDPTCPRSTL